MIEITTKSEYAGVVTLPPHKVANFPTGEPFVVMKEDYLQCSISLRMNGFSASEFLHLLHLLEMFGDRVTQLVIPFFPGARQDRTSDGMYPISARVFADAINHYGVKQVVILDPHSDVTPALVKNVSVYPITRWIANDIPMSMIGLKGIIAPDAGAQKRAFDVAAMRNLPLIQCLKHRDPKTGKLSDVEVQKVFEQGEYLVVDDICDGGATFIGLADAWFAVNPETKLSLLVSHGIFSKGTDELFARYSNIYTSDSFDQTNNPGVTVIPFNPRW
jgi:ribose-phosphate pyrophosphokinase